MANNVPNNSGMDGPPDDDEFITNSVEMFRATLTAEERRRANLSFIQSMNRVMNQTRNRTDNRCAFVNKRTGERCYENKGVYIENGTGRQKKSIYCTTNYTSGDKPKNHHKYVNTEARKQARRAAARPQAVPQTAVPQVVPQVVPQAIPQPPVQTAVRRQRSSPIVEVVEDFDFINDEEEIAEINDEEEEAVLSDIDDFEDEEFVPPPSPQRSAPSPRRPAPVVAPLSHARIQEIAASARPEDNCVICLLQLGTDRSDYLTLNCGHVFHGDCINAWMTNPSNTCPVCRTGTRAYVHPRAPTPAPSPAPTPVPVPDLIDLSDVPMPDAPAMTPTPAPAPMDPIDRIIAEELGYVPRTSSSH